MWVCIRTRITCHLVGHVPIEISELINQFIEANSGNHLKVTVVKKRQKEVCLVVLAKYAAMTTDKENNSDTYFKILG